MSYIIIVLRQMTNLLFYTSSNLIKDFEAG